MSPQLSEMGHEIVRVTPLAQNCSLYWDTNTGTGIVIDPGGDVPTILARIREHSLSIAAILLTHGHLDHAGGADELRAALSAGGLHVPLIGPTSEDEFLLSEVESSSAYFGIQGMRNVVVDRYVSDGESLSLLGRTFEVLHVPGHTPGHVVFFDRAARLAFVGDTLFRGAVGRTDFPYGNGQQLLRAIATKLLPLGDDVMIVPGHGGGSTIGEERRSNPFLR